MCGLCYTAQDRFLYVEIGRDLRGRNMLVVQVPPANCNLFLENNGCSITLSREQSPPSPALILNYNGCLVTLRIYIKSNVAPSPISSFAREKPAEWEIHSTGSVSIVSVLWCQGRSLTSCQTCWKVASKELDQLLQPRWSWAGNGCMTALNFSFAEFSSKTMFMSPLSFDSFKVFWQKKHRNKKSRVLRNDVHHFFPLLLLYLFFTVVDRNSRQAVQRSVFMYIWDMAPLDKPRRWCRDYSIYIPAVLRRLPHTGATRECHCYPRVKRALEEAAE